ncbi:MAG: hypothetical protein NVSMB51_10630 [Solirubrobacteraceae bacterium]
MSKRIISTVTLVLLAGCGSAGQPTRNPPGRAIASLGGAQATLAPDPEAAQSYPQGVGAPPHARAITPAQAASISPSAPSDAEVRAELQQMQRVQHARPKVTAGAPLIEPGGSVAAPAGLPLAVAQIIAGGNAIANFPYVYGGGHASFVDNAYDCSASVSYALAAAGLLAAPITSGELARWGDPGPGRYVTIFANDGHTFMYVDGLRFDTSGRSGPLGSRWQTAPRSLAGFVVRHPPGL